jgi:hypothetical protein
VSTPTLQQQKSNQREPYGLKQWEKTSMHNCRELAVFHRKIELQCKKKPHFTNNKQTPEFQENIASFSSVQCSSWSFNSQFR